MVARRDPHRYSSYRMNTRVTMVLIYTMLSFIIAEYSMDNRSRNVMVI